MYTAVKMPRSSTYPCCRHKTTFNAKWPRKLSCPSSFELFIWRQESFRFAPSLQNIWIVVKRPYQSAMLIRRFLECYPGIFFAYVILCFGNMFILFRCLFGLFIRIKISRSTDVLHTNMLCHLIYIIENDTFKKVAFLFLIFM